MPPLPWNWNSNHAILGGAKERCLGKLGLDARARQSVTSPNYALFERAMALRKQVVCVYGGYPRELCPVILGHSQGQEKALTYQFGGQSKSGLPPQGEWRCLWLSKATDVQLRDGPWFAGSSTLGRGAASRSSTSM
jgi:hypothetical protein